MFAQSDIPQTNLTNYLQDSKPNCRIAAINRDNFALLRFMRSHLLSYKGRYCEGFLEREGKDRPEEEQYDLYADVDVVKFIKFGRLSWSG